MSGLLKHWFGTGRDSVLKSISSKPLYITTRDAVIITVLTLIATLVLTWVYYSFMDTPAADRKYGEMTATTVLTSMAAQYLYEYSGTNNMLAESSIRYARGSTLAKYVSRREAMLYQCLYKTLESPQHREHETVIRHNFRILRTAMTQPMLVGKLVDYANNKTTLDDLHKRFPRLVEQIDEISNLPVLNIAALEFVADHINEHMTYDILVNGFADYQLADTQLVSEFLDNDMLESRANIVAEGIVGTDDAQ